MVTADVEAKRVTLSDTRVVEAADAAQKLQDNINSLAIYLPQGSKIDVPRVTDSTHFAEHIDSFLSAVRNNIIVRLEHPDIQGEAKSKLETDLERVNSTLYSLYNKRR